MSTRIASLNDNLCEIARNYIAANHYSLLLKTKRRMCLLLASLALKPPSTRGNTTSWPCIQYVLHLQATADDVCYSLPRLNPKDIRERCTSKRRSLEDEATGRYELKEVLHLLFESCGSIEEYQATIISYMEKDTLELVSYLPDLNRFWRLVELAKGYFLFDEATFMSTLGETEKAQLHIEWTYNPYKHWFIDLRDKGMLHGTKWINDVALIATFHPIINLLIMGNLSTSQPDDYFRAYAEYVELWKCLPESTRPSIRAVRSGLANYLLSSLETNSKKNWTKVELCQAMLRFGKEL